MKYFLAWLALVIAFAIGIGSFNVPKLWHLVRNGADSPGVITELIPNVHNTAKYRYQVGQFKFAGTEDGAPVSDLKIGGRVSITYDLSNPSESTLGNPKPKLDNELISVGLMAVIIPTIVVYRMKDYLAKRRKT